MLTDGAGRTTTSATVAVVVKRLRGVDVQGATVTDGTPSATDTVTLTFSGVVDLTTVKVGLDQWHHRGARRAAPLG